MNEIKPIVITGPTASGKSALAEAVAEKYNGEIISADSMQIYRGMDIGTAKPDAASKARFRYHLIDIKNIDEPYSAADYVSDAKASVADIISRGKLPIFCGGTGLYIDSLMRGDYAETDTDIPECREKLTKILQDRGADALYAMLTEKDPQAAETIHKNNVKRVIRALEICESSGMTKTEWDKRRSAMSNPLGLTVAGIFYGNRDELYERIDRRVEKMIADGLPDEVAKIYASGLFDKSPTASQAIGYKELIPYITEKSSLAEAEAALKLATRHYAKRQITWFSSKKYIIRLNIGQSGSPSTLDGMISALESAVGSVLTSAK